MLRLIGARLAVSVPVLLMVSVLSFGLLRFAPGDPARLRVGLEATPEAVEAMRRQLGLDRSVVVQYFSWLGDLLRGDLGTSYASGAPVTELIANRLPVTAQIALVALVLTIAIGIPLGVAAAVWRDSVVDHAVRAVSLIGMSVPGFVIGIGFVLLFGWYLTNVMPYSGFVRFTDDPVASLQHSLLPAFALAAPPIALVARMCRASLIEVLAQDYVSAARAYGVSGWVVTWYDALRNALLPVVTVLGVIAGSLLGGSVVVETVFGIPGLGSLLIDSFDSRDYPIVIGVLLFVATVFVLINLLIDLLYGVLNPRIRAGYEGGGR
ncbi:MULTISPECIES: ABC transporter permease [unclassified Solwaraspora]|uniref:ABC transporter permease n=1 Tax=unclassified Solwaraspora TaxID=2627926 RepID=UPI00259BB6C4|nr:ABC transporter permease [Solwaraspora sp. WMMA2056]WJK43033.1 ABC transporter permease [Solwaraspora sp. WMMA2056]